MTTIENGPPPIGERGAAEQNHASGSNGNGSTPDDIESWSQVTEWHVQQHGAKTVREFLWDEWKTKHREPKTKPEFEETARFVSRFHKIDDACVLLMPSARRIAGPDPAKISGLENVIYDMFDLEIGNQFFVDGLNFRNKAKEQRRAEQSEQEAIKAEKLRLRVRDKAKRELDAEEAAEAGEMPEAVRLDEFLAQPDDNVLYRFADVWPIGFKIVLAAAQKTGKTTMRDNITRSLVDGDPFLGRYAVSPFSGRVEIWDMEMPVKTIRRWYRAQGIRNLHRVNLRSFDGCVARLNIMDKGIRTDMAARLRDGGSRVLLIDCLEPWMAALGLEVNKPGEFGKLEPWLNEMLAEAGVGESVLFHHAGHAHVPGEARSKGDSRIRAWPGAEWFLARTGAEDDSPRVFWTYGRDVSTPKTHLKFDKVTNRLTLPDPLKLATDEFPRLEVYQDIAGILRDAMEPVHTKEIKEASSHGQNVVDETLKWYATPGRRYLLRSTQPGRRGWAYVVNEHGEQPPGIEPGSYAGPAVNDQELP